ncbi:MAG: hypothetical protein WDM80_14925 [Limisphaerales bacterium]
MTIQEARENFRKAAITNGECVDARSANQLHKEMAQAFIFLKSQGEIGCSTFKDLLHDNNNYVRVWVAAQLLSEGDLKALSVLREIEKSSGLLAFDAEMTIQEFEAGRLKSAFKIRDEKL